MNPYNDEKRCDFISDSDPFALRYWHETTANNQVFDGNIRFLTPVTFMIHT